MNRTQKHTDEYGERCVQIWKRREIPMFVEIHIRRNQNNKHTRIIQSQNTQLSQHMQKDR